MIRKKEIRIGEIVLRKELVSVETPKRKVTPRVYVNARPVGMIEKNLEYPKEVEVVTLFVDTGKPKYEVYELASHSIPYRVFVRTHWSQFYQGWQGHSDHKRKFQTRIAPAGVKIYWRIAKNLHNRVVGYDYPFRLEGGLMTNYKIAFPLRRPTQKEWKDWKHIRFAQKISSKNWILFLKAIRGLHLKDVLETEKLRERMHRIKNLEDRAKKIRNKIGQCYDGRYARAVAIGENLVFIVPTPKRKIYLVDSPEPMRALYIFERYRDAYDWASRRIGYQEARARAETYFWHAGDWRKKLTQYLN